MKALDKLKTKFNRSTEEKVDKDLFADVYDNYVVRIFRFLYLKTSSKEVAEDLTSEVFLKSWRYLRKNEKKEGFKLDKIGSFLYKIARNILIDFYRAKRETVEINAEIREKLPDLSQDIISDLAVKQEVEELMAVLSEMRDEYKEAIILRYVEELSIPEVAEVMEKNEGATRVLLHRAVKSLEKSMMRLRESQRK